jgi:hypothetical protein
MSKTSSLEHLRSHEVETTFDATTARLRTRAMCNGVKAKLLKELHDPHCAQADLVVACPASPAKDAKTWTTWWNGSAKMQSASKSACDRIDHDASRWMEFPHLGNAVQRHLAVLDAVLLGDDHRRAKSASECLVGISNAWSLFTSSTKLRDGLTDNCIRLLAEKAVNIVPTLRYADERALRLIKLGLNNPFYYSLPSTSSRSDTRSTAESMLTFLLRLTRHFCDVPPEFITSVVFDIASCVALVRADRGSSMSARLVAELHARTFWDHAVGAAEINARFQSSLDPNVRELLRSDYYGVLREHGISFRDLYRLLAPVKVLGEVNIWRNVSPTKRTMGKYISLSSAANQVVFVRAERVEIMLTARDGEPRRVKVDAPRDDLDLMEAIECARASS